MNTGAGMQDLDKALADITAIRSQMARGAEFRGYGPMTVAATGGLALVAAVIQALGCPTPRPTSSPISLCGSRPPPSRSF